MFMLNFSSKSLLTPKLKSVPELVIYKSMTDTSKGPMIHYGMANTKTGMYIGEMYARPVKNSFFSVYYPTLFGCKSFKIEKLIVDERGFGYGRKFIDFAKKESMKYGCKGRLNLLASRLYDPENPPHLFYRKMGFTSRFKGKIKYFDECIKNGCQIDWMESLNLPMYLPIKKENRLLKLFNRLKNFIK